MHREPTAFSAAFGSAKHRRTQRKPIGNQIDATFIVAEDRLRKFTWTAVGIRYQQSKNLDPRQQFSLRVGYEETICSFLYGVGRVCSDLLGSGSPAKPAKSASNEKAITDLEKSAWESYRNKQADAFKKLMSQDYCGAYSDALKTLDMEVVDMAKTDLRDYSLPDMKVVFPIADVAVTRYKATIQMTSEGKDMSGTYNSASVWVKKSGKWLEVLHTEAKAQ